jgi:arylsulfatase A-like enzyme
MTELGARVSDHRWPGPGGVVEDSIVALADLVRTAADLIDESEPRVARDLRIHATKHTVQGIEGLLRLTQ